MRISLEEYRTKSNKSSFFGVYMNPITFVENNIYFIGMYFVNGNLLLRFYKKLDENHGKLLLQKYISKLDKYNEVPEWNSLIDFVKYGFCNKLFFDITKDIEL